MKDNFHCLIVSNIAIEKSNLSDLWTLVCCLVCLWEGLRPSLYAWCTAIWGWMALVRVFSSTIKDLLWPFGWIFMNISFRNHLYFLAKFLPFLLWATSFCNFSIDSKPPWTNSLSSKSLFYILGILFLVGTLKDNLYHGASKAESGPNCQDLNPGSHSPFIHLLICKWG